MIIWVPESAKAKDKIIYESSSEAFRAKLKLITRKLTITSLDDIDNNALAESLAFSEPVSPVTSTRNINP